MKFLTKFYKSNFNKQKGFSLLEMGFFIAIIAIIAFPMFEYMFSLQRAEKYKETRVKMRKIHDAITQFYHSNQSAQYGEEKIYPPTKFTSATALTEPLKHRGVIENNSYGNGSYIMEASTTFDYHRPWHIFDTNVNSVSSCWAPPLAPGFGVNYNTYYTNNGQYSGPVKTTSNGSDYYGEWAQITLPTKIRLTKYQLNTIKEEVSRGPYKFYIFGSNNGSSWDLLDIRENQTYDSLGYGNTHTVSTNNSYNIFRLVVNSRNGNGWMSVANWDIWGQESGIGHILPAPTDITLPIDNSAYGEGMTSDFKIATTTNKIIYYGGIPIDNLNLTIEDSVDAWGNKFSYYVSQGAVESFNYIGDDNDLNVTNFDLKSSNDDAIIYAIISHGEDGYGAYKKDGTQNDFANASNYEKNNIYENSKIITASSRLVLSSGSINDIAFGYKKNDIAANHYTVGDQLGFSTEGDAFKIDSSSQNIGIGTTSPAQSALVVGGNIAINANDQIAVNMGVNSNDEAMIKFVSSATGSSFIDFNQTNSGQDFKGRIAYNNSNDSLNFYTGSNTTPKMTINSNGYVGIGTSDPWTILDVNGHLVPAPGHGLYFTLNPDKRNESYIQYYSEDGENTKLKFRNGYDCEDDIDFFQQNATQLSIACDINVYTSIHSDNAEIIAGPAAMGNAGHGSGYASFGHKNFINSTSQYAFLHSWDGVGIVNVSPNRLFRFSINNSWVMLYSSAGNFIMKDGKALDLNHTACPSWYVYGCDGTFIRRYGDLQLYVDDWVYLSDTNTGSIGRIKWSSIDGLYSYQTYWSDIRLKENIRPMESILDKFMQLRTRIYDHKKDTNLWNTANLPANYNVFGFVAQEVAELFPEIVAEDTEGYFSIDGSKFPALIIKALQEAKLDKDKQIKLLKKRVKKLDKRLRKLERRKARQIY